jgi:hypothetical protein
MDSVAITRPGRILGPVTLAVFLLTLGAVARITRFANSDELFRGVRERLAYLRGPDAFINQMLGCPWCLSIWVGAALAPAAWYLGDYAAYQIPAAALTMSYLYALVAAHLDDS